MSSKLSLLKIIDKFLFLRIDDIKRSVQYQKLATDAGNIGEKEFKAITYISSILFILSPFVIVAIMYISNQKLKNSIKIKSDIYSHINSYISNKNTIEVLGRTFIASNSFENKGQLESKIEGILNSKGLKNDSFKVENFEIINTKTKIIHINALISFKNMALENLSKVMIAFLEREKMKIESFSVTKDDKSLLLNGKISILHYGKTNI